MRLGRGETWDLCKAWFLVSSAFFILGVLSGYKFSLLTFILVFLIVGGAVIFHEIGHKYVAERYGYYARFVSNDFMLLLGVGMAFLGFIFIAPGAVHVQGLTDKKRNALIAWAGPAVNAVLAFIAFLMIQVTGFTGYFGVILRVNAILGGFNMLPVPGFDGEKIWQGDKTLYLATVIVLGILVFLSFAG